MPRINLLPWREEARKERQKQFVVQLLGAAVLGGLILFYGITTVNGWVNHQESRNTFLQEQIRELDRKIAEIEDLQDTKRRLLSRMQIIEELQKSRPDGVRLFDSLAHTVPTGVYVTEVRQNGSNLEIRGVAESNARVSAYMRNIDGSDWMTRPNVEVIETRTQRRGARGDEQRVREFTIRARVVTPGGEGG
jgi:type IV pilus assembly protein PilN